MNGRRTALLVTAADDLFLYEFGTRALRRLTRTRGNGGGAVLQPGRRAGSPSCAAATSGSSTSAGRAERALTTRRIGGRPQRQARLGLPGGDLRPRATSRATGGAPTRARIALLRLDDTKVPRYPMVDDLPEQPRLETTRYPKAGDPNPEARLGIVEASGGPPALGRPLALRRRRAAPRRRHLEPGQPPRASSRCRTASRAGSTSSPPTRPRCARASLLPREDAGLGGAAGERPRLAPRRRASSGCPSAAGWKHVYRYRGDGTLVAPVTRGEWEARTLHGDRRGGGLGLLLGHRAQPHRRRRLPHPPRRHGACSGSPAADGHARRPASTPPSRLYLDTWSDVTTPPQVRLHRADGAEARVVDANPVPALAQYRLVAAGDAARARPRRVR